MALYANGIKLESSRELEESEILQLKSRYEKAVRIYGWHFKIGILIFVTCLFSAVVERTHSFLSDREIPDSGFLVFLFCCVLPPLVGSIQEIALPTSKRSQLLFSFVYFSGLLALVLPSSLSAIVGGAAVLATLLLGWIMILLRWFDAKRYLPMISRGLMDIEGKKVDRYVEFGQQGEELIALEVLPTSHLVYRVGDQQWKSWDRVDVMEISDEQRRHLLAPWHGAPRNHGFEGLKFFQRRLTREEMAELTDLRRRLKKKAVISILPSLYFSAVGVRLIENLLTQNLQSELSTNAWLVAVIMGIFFPLKWLFRWIKLGRDIKAPQIVSIQAQDQEGRGDVILEEFLSESKLLWSQNGRPSYWRVTKFF